MNNSQSINMLINNEMGAATNRNQAHLLPQAHHLQHQQVHPQQQQQQTQPLNADQRQVALADLFNSLSNLANNQQQLTLNNNLHQHQHHHHQQQQQHLQPPPIPPPTSIALTNSIQSAMAATLLRQQQQLASRIRPPQVSQPQQLQHQVTQQQSHSPFFAASEQAHLFNGVLEQDVQSTSGQQQSMAQQQQSHQRINYCTICNKELCNKYFMKTHMLKMHGINLEMEQPDESNEADEQGDGDEDRACSGSEQVDEEDEAYAAGDEDDDREHHQQQQPKSSTSEQGWSPVAKKPPQSSTGVKRTAKRSGSSLVKKQSTSKGATSVLNGFAGNSMGGVVCDICNKELCSKYFLKVHKQNTHGITDYQDPGQFMYPFANPIAAPNPFMVPAAIATPNLVGSPTFPSMNPLSMFSNTQQQQTAAEDCSLVGKRSGGLKKLRLNQSKPHQVVGASLLDIEKANQQPVDATNRVHSKQIENFYRLIIAQQQQQQQQQPPQPAPLPAAPAHQPLLPMADPMSAAANPLRALMCFGVMNPAGSLGPTGMSPAMIVDSILRNQHLFSRNHSGNVGASPAKTSAGGSGNNKSKDVNNNSNEPTSNKKHSNENKTSKDSNSNSSSSSRYFSHYTEACPMCDRRFKSIKWLKTHMMNDHKQEIGAYMQMMMQYLYASKSQQMAAATMAAFEQQQHHNLAHHLSNQSHAMQFQQPVNVNNTAKTFQSSHFGTNQNPFNTALSLATESASRRNSEFCTSSGEQMMPEVANDYVIDARRERLDSLSPSTGISLRSPASPSTSRLLAFVQDNPATTPASTLSGTAAATTCGLNFELERLRKGRPMKTEPSLLSGGLLLNDEDDEDENGDQEGDVSREVDDYSGTGDDNSNTDCGHAEEESRCSGADKGGQQQQLLQSTIEIKTTSS